MKNIFVRENNFSTEFFFLVKMKYYYLPFANPDLLRQQEVSLIPERPMLDGCRSIEWPLFQAFC